MTNKAPPQHSLPLLPHEWLRTVVPDALIRGFLEEARASTAYQSMEAVPAELFPSLPSFDAFEEGMVHAAVAEGGETYESGQKRAHFYLSHILNAVNFELHHRKVFWVDESLAWMLQHTRLDIEGAALRLPFPCFAIVFQDEATLELLRAHIMNTAVTRAAAFAAMKTVTVYVTRGKNTDGGVDLDVSFVTDTAPPFKVTRSIHVRPTDDLETILSSDSAGLDPTLVGPQFRTSELRSLVHLVINAILYANSAVMPWAVVRAPPQQHRAKVRRLGAKRIKHVQPKPSALRKAFSSEDVFFLPGKIPISQLRQLRDIERSARGGELFSRFMVRGHWRRPAANWSEQRPRWIEPYWKGPEMGALVEREYRLLA